MPYSANSYAFALSMHRDALLELLPQIPAEKGDFAPWEGGMSFLKITDHLASTTNGLLSTLAGQKPERLPPSPDLGAATVRLQALTGQLKEALRGLSEEQLSADVPAFGRTMPLFRLIDFLVQHDAHHKGQLWLMARMIGLEPPMFVKM